MDAMEIIGLDLHKRESQLCMKSADGLITERRIVTSRDRLTAVLGPRPRARILLEATTESEWVARHLEAFGHEVIVADPNFAPMYANRSRRSKTDKRDARTLLEACATGVYRPAHRLRDGAPYDARKIRLPRPRRTGTPAEMPEETPRVS
jgi:transposase